MGVPADGSRKGRTAGDLKIGEMTGAVFSNSLAQYAKLARSLPAAATSLGGAVARQSVTGAEKGLTSLRPKSPLSLAPKTVFNVGITPHRVFATASVPFAESKAMAKAIGATSGSATCPAPKCRCTSPGRAWLPFHPLSWRMRWKPLSKKPRACSWPNRRRNLQPSPQ